MPTIELALQDRPQHLEHDEVAGFIDQKLADQNTTLAQAIRAKNLYFRISVVGNCNLSCPFCHNEGGPNAGRLELSQAMRYVAAAKQVGFHRVQFTGGEPLLHSRIADFVAAAKEIVPDVGVTTNGTLLGRRCSDLIRSGVTRVHVSLQAETLEESDPDNWCIPETLSVAANTLVDAGATVRFNLPVEHQSLSKAADFLERTRHTAWTYNLFAILRAENTTGDSEGSYLGELRKIVLKANAGTASRAQVRGYIEPVGVRCSSCPKKRLCTEQSRSLRLGVDEILRPCLASRAWDISPERGSIEERVRVASLLATDW